jgi:hypothetical protein
MIKTEAVASTLEQVYSGLSSESDQYLLMVAMKSGVFPIEDTRLMDAFFDRFYKGTEYRVFLPGNEMANKNMM